MKRIVIIDGNSLINRAYYAMQRPMITKDGIFTQGIYGFINMLSKILEDYSPEYITVTFDLKAPTFRHKAYKDYKAGRQKMPPELAMQLPLLKDVLRAMNIKVVELEGYEADDLIGTISREFEENNIEPLIITGDKDALQLCSDLTKVIITKKGISEFDVYDRNKMIEVYSLTPEQFIDLKGLMGDKSDNIPGIPGVGEKTGIKLLQQFNTVENLIKNYNEIENNNLKQKVEDNIDLILLSKKLATINRNVPIEINLQNHLYSEPNLEELRDIYSKLEFNKFLKKLSLKGVSGSDEKKEYKVIQVSDISQLDVLKDKECFVKVFSDDNHKETPNAECLGIADEEKIYFIKTKDREFFKKIIAKFNELNLNLKGHGIKKDLYFLMQYGFSAFQVVFDTEIASYVLNPGRSSYAFKDILTETLFLEIDDEKDAIGTSSQTSIFEDDFSSHIKYLEAYFGFLEQLTSYLSENIDKEDLSYVFKEIELPLIRVLTSMEIAGIHVDNKVLDSIGANLIREADKLQKQIFEVAGEEFNINSPKQLGVILFEKLQLPAGKKNKNGYSTSADVLDKLRDKTPIVDLILRYRTVTKLNSTYVEGLIPLVSSDNRVHAHFQQTVTATGRISCTEPNLQNIPVRDPAGRELRKAYVSPDGYVLVGADYSQIELRVLAHLSKDENLVEAFNNGEDIHKLTASKVLGIPVEKITPDDRRKAKAVNFGVIYGMSSFGLSEEVKITRKEAEKYINDYFDKYTGVKAFLDEQIKHAKENGYTLTAMGRKRYVNELKSSNFMVRNFGERLAMNTPIQGTAADIIKLAMIKVYDLLKEKEIESSLILQVHDELILRVKEDYADEAKKLLKNAMESAFDMIVPLKSEPSVGKSWFDLK